MKRVLVTGATGFIGNYVVEELLKRNCSVITSSAHPGKAKEADWFKKTEYIPFDFEQFTTTINYYDYFGKPDCMIHLAWEGLPNYKSTFHVDINLPRHISFLSNLISNGLHDLTVTGTCFEYGMQEGCLKEDMPCFPSNPYAIAKDELRKKLEGINKEHPFIFKWIRLFYMYGEGQNPNSLLSQLDRALGNGDTVFNMSGGEQVRDFLPVQDVAAYISEITLQQKHTGIINCCSGVPVTVKDFVETYLKQKAKTIQLNLGYYKYADYEPMRFWGDRTRLDTIVNKL